MFSVKIVKRDVYNHIILSDSTTILQVRTYHNKSDQPDSILSMLGTSAVQLEQGTATFPIQLKPSYSLIMCTSGTTVLQRDPYLFFSGQDAEVPSNLIMSSTFPVLISGGFDICPQGYVLSFDTPNVRKGPAQCQRCPAGKYSLLPLAGRDGLSDSIDPACLNCPAGGNCLLGGNNVTFALGTWIQDTST